MSRQIESLKSQMDKVKDFTGLARGGSSLEKEQVITDLEERVNRLVKENAVLRQTEEAEEKVRLMQSKISILDDQNGNLQDS
jgi:hypothetical protein